MTPLWRRLRSAVIPAKREPRSSAIAEGPVPAREPGPSVECGSQPSCGPGSRVSRHGRSPGMTVVGRHASVGDNRPLPQRHVPRPRWTSRSYFFPRAVPGLLFFASPTVRPLRASLTTNRPALTSADPLPALRAARSSASWALSTSMILPISHRTSPGA